MGRGRELEWVAGGYPFAASATGRPGRHSGAWPRRRERRPPPAARWQEEDDSEGDGLGQGKRYIDFSYLFLFSFC